MENYKNYFVYADAVKNGLSTIPIYVPEITAENIDDHIDGIFSILKDGIETDYVHNLKINISWGGDINCDLFIIDYWFSLFMWKMLLTNNEEVRPKHIFFTPELKRKNIKAFVDKFVLTKDAKIKFGNEFLNNNICDSLWAYSYIEHFSYYLACTINNEDNIELMNKSEDFYNLLHASMKGIAFEDVKDAGLELTDKAISIIKDSSKYLGYEHGLAASFKASEAINPRQFKEAVLNIGTKPNGTGGIYPFVIDSNFQNGGINDPLSYFIESSSARTAQILSKQNVGDSGEFARVLGLNNTDTILNPNPDYECLSRNFIEFQVKTAKHLSMIKNRYYRFNPKGMEHIVDDTDKSLIGKTILLRSPMTCSCGKSICRRCYGDLYYTNININIGKIAAEILSSQLTQTLLSAKHLLETKIQAIKWNPEFSDYFDLNINAIKIIDDLDINLSKYFLVIDPNDIYLENEEEDSISFDEDENEEILIEDDVDIYNEYVPYFYIKTPTGEEIKFGSENGSNSLYISKELNTIIRKKAIPDDGKALVPLSALTDITLFYVKILNNEISKTMNDIINIINKSSVTENLTKDQAMQSIVDLIIDGNLNIDAVHLEVILANQIVDAKNILKKPNWNDPNVQYRIFSLDHALINNPSVIITLLYKDIGKVMYTPLTYSKHAPSFFDLFFVEEPQSYMSSNLLDTEPVIDSPEKGIVMVKDVK